MQLDLTGKRALITGASRGIGRSITEVLHSEGCSVVLNGRTHATLESAAATLPGACVSVGDVTRPDEAARVVAESISLLGGLDILVCNVGSGRSVPPGEESYDEWQRVLAVNLWSAINTIGAARAALAVASGSIVCVSSICGLEVVPGAPVTYSVAKASLNAYIRGMSRPFGKEGVRINAVAPGNILFDGSVWWRRLAEDPADVQAMLERDVALSALGDPRSVADVVAYLASPRARFVTGSVWTMDGGQVRG